MSHFSRSCNCYLHFLQIQREHALSSQQEQRDDDMLDFLVDTSPAMPPASDTSEALSEGFRTIPSRNSKGQTVSRKTSTRSLSSAGRRNKKQRQLVPSPARRPTSYDADDESESSMSSLSSVASIRNTHPSPSSHLAFNDPFLCDVSMVPGSPSPPLPIAAGELLHLEESPQQQPERGVYPADLGSSRSSPIADALANLPRLDKTTAALVELYDLLDKGRAPLKMFDIVVAFIEKHNGRTFPQNRIIKRRDALLNDLRKLFPTPEAEAIPVALETGNEELAPEGYQRVPRHTVMVQRWPIVKVLQDYLLDLQLFGNKQNLVNVRDPFGKYISENPNTDRELLAGQWYSRTWDAKIADPEKEFLLVIELYLDKTGRNASLKSYCGEPVIMSTPLLNQACRQDASAW